MDNTDKYIEGLFDAARGQSPKRSLAEVKSGFDLAIASGYEPSFKLANNIFNKINLIMGTGTVLLALAIFSLTAHEKPTPQKVQMVEMITEEVKNERPTQESILKEEGSISIETSVTTPVKREIEMDTSDEQESKIVSAKPKEKASHGFVKSTGSVSPFSSKRKGHGLITKALQDNITFTLNNSTTKAELEDIKRQATEAGVDLNYRIRGSKSIKRLKLDVALRTDESLHKSSISLTGKFEFTIGWVIDESGRAVEFWNDLNEDEEGPLFEEGEGEGLFDNE